MLHAATKICALLAVLVLTACAGASGPTMMDVAGTYAGGISVDAADIDGTLEITQIGTELTAVFDAPSFGVRAEGTGTIIGDMIELSLRYNIECEGVATLTGRILAETMRYTGDITASDCTADMAGTFSFTRR